MVRIGMLCAIASCLVLWFGLSAPPLVAEDSPSAADKALRKKYRRLVERLASPNDSPTVRNSPPGRRSIMFPTDYDVEAQKRVAAARKELHEHVADALPALVKALDDDRYCLTVLWAETNHYNISVGGVCRELIQSHLEVYRPAIRFDGPGHWNKYAYPVSKEWWKSRRERSLFELQIEAITWAIEKREAEPEERITPDRRHEVRDLRRQIDLLSRSEQPLPPRRLLPMVLPPEAVR